MNNILKKLGTGMILSSTVLLGGCQSVGDINPDPMQSDICETARTPDKHYTWVGAAAGAVFGALIGHHTTDDRSKERGRRIKGAVIGGIAGGVGGKSISDVLNRGRMQTRQLAQGVIEARMSAEVLFDIGKHRVKNRDIQELQRLAQVVQSCTNYRLTIVGHTDSTGSDALNQRLSENRANSVARVLSEIGVIRQMRTTGEGEHSPIETNATSEGRSQNRRVQFLLSPISYSGG